MASYIGVEGDPGSAHDHGSNEETDGGTASRRAVQRPWVVYYVIGVAWAGAVPWGVLGVGAILQPLGEGWLELFGALLLFIVPVVLAGAFGVGLWRGRKWGYWGAMLVVASMAGGFGFGVLTFILGGGPWIWWLSQGRIVFVTITVANTLAVIALRSRGVRAWCGDPRFPWERG